MGTALEDLTIVIPTMNRPQWIKRVFIYYSKNTFHGTILVLDSSNQETFNLIKKTSESYKNLKIDLYNFPRMSNQQVMFAGSGKIQTKYSVNLADDDILLVEGLEKAIVFLNNEKLYSGVLGNGYMISTLNNQPFGKINNILNYELTNYSDDDVFLRVSSYFNNIKNTSFAVVRTEVFKEGYEKIMSFDRFFQTFMFGELIQSVLYLTKGKIMKIDSDYLVRQAHPENTYHLYSKKIIDKNEWDKAFITLKNYLQKTFEYKKNFEIDVILKNVTYEKANTLEKPQKLTIIYLFLKKEFIKTFLKRLKYFLHDVYKVKNFEKTVELNNFIRIVDKKNI